VPRRLMIRKVLQTSILIALSFITAECATRSILAIPDVFRLISRANSDVARRWDWIKKHHGRELLREEYPFDVYDPARGWALKAGIRHGPMFKQASVNSNSRGIRGTREFSYDKSPETFRMLILGDSFTFGEEVSDHETFPYYLQELLPDAQVINFGVHGYGHDQMLLYLRQEGVKYRPDVVVLGYASCDDERNLMYFKGYERPKFEVKEGELVLKRAHVPPPAEVIRDYPWRSQFLDLPRILIENSYYGSPRYRLESDRITNAILAEIVRTVRDIGAVPVFVDLDSALSNNTSPELTGSEKAFAERCALLSVACISLRRTILASGWRGRKRLKEGHFSPDANRLVAQGIKEGILRMGLDAGGARSR